ncbi:MAG: DUF120 domain-containing protein [Thermoplasmata archaeon]
MKDYEIIFILKEIAIRGGIYKHIILKTGKFGEEIGYTQQTISRKINMLAKMGYRDKFVLERGIKVKINKIGIDLMIKEIKKIKKIDELMQKIVIIGKVTSGMGEGTYYMNREGYIKQFLELFNEKPYPGTLNILVEESEIISYLKENAKYILKGFVEENRTFGNVFVHKALINEDRCYAIFPERGHYENIIEIVSSENLRKKYSLVDGDTVNITIFPLD